MHPLTHRCLSHMRTCTRNPGPCTVHPPTHKSIHHTRAHAHAKPGPMALAPTHTLKYLSHARTQMHAHSVRSYTTHISNTFNTHFLSATEYHSDADYNSRRVGVVVVVVVVVVHTFKNGLTFEHLDRFASYLEGSCTRVSRFTSYAYVMIQHPTSITSLPT